MKQETQVDQTAEDQRMLQAAMLHAAFNAPDATLSEEGGKGKEERKEGAVSPRNGAVLPPGTGRPKGVKNKLTNLRDAVLEAFDTVGGPEYLVRLANGTQSDRAAFVSIINKVLPSQINANVEGGIQVQLSWLGSRSIGTVTAQQAEQVTQVIDLERDSGGKYRIKDQEAPDAGTPPAAGWQEGGKDA